MYTYSSHAYNEYQYVREIGLSLPKLVPHQKHMVSYFTSLTLISEPPAFLTRGGDTIVLQQGVPAFCDENDDDNVDDGPITTK
jgi:hypothetical protein